MTPEQTRKYLSSSVDILDAELADLIDDPRPRRRVLVQDIASRLHGTILVAREYVDPALHQRMLDVRGAIEVALRQTETVAPGSQVWNDAIDAVDEGITAMRSLIQEIP